MKTEAPEHLDWGLEEPSRFPLKPAGWELVDSVITITCPHRFDGSQPYAFQAFPDTDSRIITGVRQLLDSRAEDFNVAASSIKPEAWRLLFYRGFFTAEALTAFRFHAELALRHLCVECDDGGDPPRAWLGTDLSIAEIANQLEPTLREMGENQAAAAWLILCLAQRANLTKAEVLQCTWWDPIWITAFTKNVRFNP